MVVITAIATPIVTFVKCKKSQVGEGIRQKIKNLLSFGMLIRFHLQAFLFITLLVIAELRLENGSTLNHAGSYVFAILSIIMLILFISLNPVHYTVAKQR